MPQVTVYKCPPTLALLAVAALRVGLRMTRSWETPGPDSRRRRATFFYPLQALPHSAVTAFWHRRTRTIFHSAITTSRKRQDGPCVNTATLMKYPTRSSVSWHNGHLSDLTLKMYACSYPVVSTSFDAQVLLCTHFYATSPVTYLPQRHNSVLDSHLR